MSAAFPTSILTHFSFSNPLYSLIKRCFAAAAVDIST